MKLVLAILDDNGKQIQTFDIGELTINLSACKASLPTLARVPARKPTASEAILDVLTTWPARPATIAEATGLKPSTVRAALSRLVQKGLVVKTQFGDYELADWGERIKVGAPAKKQTLSEAFLEAMGI